MSRQPLPSIEPADLRDVATEERVDRIWGRLEQDLAAQRVRPAARPSRTAVWALAATFAAFGVGLFAGRVVWKERPIGASPVVATNDRATVDVFAAGSQQRTYSLPGGGSVTLEPGSMVEMERAAGGSVKLRLLSGEASLDTAQAADQGFALVSGDATVATAPGSQVRVRQSADNKLLSVDVVGGSAEVSSPAGTRALKKGQQLDDVPTHTTIAVNNPSAVRVTTLFGKRRSHGDGSQASIAVAPSWRQLHDADKMAEALEALKQQPGGISGAIKSANSAAELMEIVDVARSKGGDSASALMALTRVADEFPSTAYGSVAARTLSKLYEAKGQSDLAKKYRDQAAQKGVFSEDALCDQMLAEENEGHKTEASARATEYLGKYPNGKCKDDAKLILSGGNAGGDADSPASDDPAPSASALPVAPVGSASASSAPSSAPAASGVPSAKPQ